MARHNACRDCHDVAAAVYSGRMTMTTHHAVELHHAVNRSSSRIASSRLTENHNFVPKAEIMSVLGVTMENAVRMGCVVSTLRDHCGRLRTGVLVRMQE